MHIAHGRTKKHKFTVQSGTKSGTRIVMRYADSTVSVRINHTWSTLQAPRINTESMTSIVSQKGEMFGLNEGDLHL